MKIPKKLINSLGGPYVYEGASLSTFNSKPYLLWNALENEEIISHAIKKKKGILHGIAYEIKNSSTNRIEAQEEHFLSCSPWQIMQPSYEEATKKKILETLLKEELKKELIDYIPSKEKEYFHYRNKMEFSFAEHEGNLTLAFFRRDGSGKIPLQACLLAKECINETANYILEKLKTEKVKAESLKSLIVRASKNEDLVAALFTKERIKISSIEPWKKLKGFIHFYSKPESPASIPTEKQMEWGNVSLTDTIKNSTLTYEVLNFFQINPPMLENALDAIKKHLNTHEVLDLYGGVGTISIALKESIKKCIIGEIDEIAINYAKINCKKNHCENYTCLAAPAEHLLANIKKDQTLIVDPPRGGLHPKIIKHILKDKPTQIIYLACNPISQVRDVKPLLESYIVTYSAGFNFFPRTPHIESLIVLQVKNP